MSRIIIPLLAAALAAPVLAGWLPEERLTSRTGYSDRTCASGARAAAFDPAGNLHVVWYGTSAGLQQVWYSRRDAATGEWSADTAVTAGPGAALTPTVATDGAGNAHIVWLARDTAVCYRRRSAAGTWGEVETVRTAYRLADPAVAVGRADSVHLVWSEYGVADIYDVFARSRGAAGWGDAARLSSQQPGQYCVRPSVASTASGHLAVAWAYVYDVKICYRPRDDTGWGRVDTLASGYGCTSPSLFISPSGVSHCAWWRELPGGSQEALFYRQRRDGVWLDTVRVPVARRHLEPASVVVNDPGAVGVAYVADSANSIQVRYAQADSLGRNWTGPFRLTDVVGSKDNVTVACGPSDELAVVWTDYRHNVTYPDVYCLRSGTILDLAVRELWMADSVDSGGVVTPAAVVANQGEDTMSFATWMFLPNGYSESLCVTGLAPGEIDTLTFPDWVAHARDEQVATCSIPRTANDTCPANNVLRHVFFVTVCDFAAESLAGPAMVRRGDTARVRAFLLNRGNVGGNGLFRFEVFDSLGARLRTESLSVSLAPDSCVALGFTFVPPAPGGYRCRGKVVLTGDMCPGNDTASAWLSAWEPDVGIESIIAPGPSVDSGATLRPAVRVANRSSCSVDCFARMGIGDGYAADTAVEGLDPGESRTVEFPDWLPVTRGTQALACSLFTLPDSTLGAVTSGTTFVRVFNVAAESIASPLGDIRVGEPVVLAARVANPGNEQATLSAWFEVRRADSLVVRSDPQVVTLPAGTDTTIEWGERAFAPGSYVAVCSVRAAGDMDPADDTASAVFTAHPGDLWLTAIVAPETRVDSGVVVMPAIGVRNAGSGPARFAAWFAVDDGYSDSVSVAALSPGRDTVVEFSTWTPLARGTRALACSLLALPESTVVGPLAGSTFVRVVDVAANTVVAPRGPMPPGVVEPAVRFGNRGNEEELVTCRLAIAGAGYGDSAAVRLGPRRDSTVRFREWDAAPGVYELVATAQVAGEMVPHNDTCRLVVWVDTLSVWRWQRLADMPAGRPVRRGGRLVSAPEGLLATRGTETNDWLCYDPDLDEWQVLCSLPRVPGGERVRDGAAACRDGDSVLLVKGRGQRGVWCYSLAGDAWDTLAPLPEGLKPIRYGTGMAFIPGDTDRVYLLTGSGGLRLLVYWVGPAQWHDCRTMPQGSEGRECRHGSDLCALGGRLFGLKGGSDEFYEYRPAGDSWVALAPVPRAGSSGRSRRTGKGAALTSDGVGSVYALKGRGNEFWRYDAGGDSWVQLDDVPPGGDRRRVGRGAALAWHEGRVYVLKGGGCRELWCYDPLAAGVGRSGVQERGEDGGLRSEGRLPTVVRGTLMLPGPGLGTRYGLSGRNPLMSRATLLDACGRRVMTLAPGANDVSGLAPGVYFVCREGSRGGVVEGWSVRRVVVAD